MLLTGEQPATLESQQQAREEILYMLEGRETIEVIDDGKVIAHVVPINETL